MNKSFNPFYYLITFIFVSAIQISPQARFHLFEDNEQRTFNKLIKEFVNPKGSICYIDSIILLDINQNPWKWSFEYQGQLISYIHDFSCYSGIWIPNFRISRQYDNHKLICSTTEHFENSTWVPLRKDSLAYDSSGNLILTLFLIKSTGGWTNSSLSNIFYDQYNKKISQSYLIWEENNWHEMEKDSFFYKDDNLLDYWFISKKDENGIWNFDRKYIFSYNDKNQLDSVIIKKWGEGIWSNLYKFNFVYDSNNLIAEYLFNIWDETAWLIDNRECYTFNSEGYFVSGLYQKYYNNSWNEADGILSIKNPDGLNLGFMNISRYNIYYKLTTVSDKYPNRIHDYRLSNYPNPFNPNTIITFSIKERGLVSLKVYDMLGREAADLLHEEKESGTYTIPFNGCQLSSGMYVCALKAKGYTISHKILLIK